MLIMIEKDSATRVAKEVADDAEAQSYADRGFTVFRVVDGVSVPFVRETEEAPVAAKKAAKKG